MVHFTTHRYRDSSGRAYSVEFTASSELIAMAHRWERDGAAGWLVDVGAVRTTYYEAEPSREENMLAVERLIAAEIGRQEAKGVIR